MEIEDLYSIGEQKLYRMLWNPEILGDPSVVRDILTLVATPDIENTYGWTSLQYAAKWGCLGACRVLIDAGASLDSQNTGDGYSALHWAARNGHFDICKLLIDAGASLDIRSYNGERPLHAATITGQLEICKLLVERGANLDTLGTLLHYAIYWKKYHVYDYFYGMIRET